MIGQLFNDAVYHSEATYCHGKWETYEISYVVPISSSRFETGAC